MWQRLIGLAGDTVGTAVGAVAGVVEFVSSATAGSVTTAPGRVHVPIDGVHHDADAASRAEELLVAHEAVVRAEVNAALGDVLIEFVPELITMGEVTELVRAAEQACGLAAAAPLARPEHPGAPGGVMQEAVLLGLNVVGLAYTAVGRALPLGPAALGLSVLAHVDAAPALRSLFTQVVGEPVAAPLLAGAAVVANTTGRRPVGLLVDACHRYALYQEARAHRVTWTAWEGELAHRPGAYRAAPAPACPRPVPLPPGPVQKVAHTATGTALAGAALLTALGVHPLANAVLAAGLPKAARTGQDAYAAGLGRGVAARGSLVLDRSALRRLDRLDTVVLDADVLRTGRHGVEEVVPLEGDSGPAASALVERAHDLVDRRRPDRARRRQGWSVEPVGRAATGWIAELAAELAHRASTVLLLRRGDDPVALVGVSEILDPFTEAVVAAAGQVGVVLVGGSEDLVPRTDADGAVPGGDDLAESVRELQATGHVVAVLSEHHDVALAAADLGIGLVPPGGTPAWTADTLIRTLSEACLLLEAIEPARRVGRRAAQLAAAGSGLGVLLALLGPAVGAPARASVAVHTAALCAYGIGTWSAITVARRPAPVATDRMPWHAMSSRAVLTQLDSARSGLAEPEARRRRTPPRHDDHDEIGLVRASAEELANPITTALTAGAGVSAATGSVLDPLSIVFVLAVNALIGGVQRVSAQSALRTLHRSSATRVRVRRGEHEVEHTADELVGGDVIRLQAGDAVPADSRVLAGHGLEIDESSLTGESVPASKSAHATSARTLGDRRSMLYEGTTVATGRAEAVVVATGEHTEAGRTLRESAGQAPPTGVESRLRELTARILPVSVGAGVALVAIDLLRGRPAGVALTRAVSLAVAAVPEGLPFVATVAELAAARRLSARGALVRNPSTIEALGRVSVLCFDKTGTLTEGRISLRQVSDGTRSATVDEPLTTDLQGIVSTAVRASPFRADRRHITHQTDRAVLRGARELDISAENGHAFVEALDELPFESHRGYHATLWRGRSGNRISVKGAPEVILPLCTTRRTADTSSPLDGDRAAIDAEVHRLARHGHRVLAVAQRPTTGSRLGEADVAELEFRGLVGLVDPVRPTAAQAVATLRAAGVAIVMITGDHPSTAESIAAELDVLDGRTVMTGAEMDELTDAQLTDALPRTAVFARVTPAQKARIVGLHQQSGHPVAVTGDGTNDAPAIRLADVGIALGARATPAAREAADLVVTDDRIETITDAIVEGRGMWASVRDALSILLGGNLGEIAYTLGTGLFGRDATLNARQLLLINLLTDVLPAMAVAVRPPPDSTPAELLAHGPEASLGASLDRDIQVRAAITATAAAAAWMASRPLSTSAQANTSGLVALVGSQLAQTLVVRGRTPLVAAAVGGSIVLLVVAVQVPGVSGIVGSTPLLPHQWGIALTAAAAAGGAQLVAQRRLGATG